MKVSIDVIFLPNKLQLHSFLFFSSALTVTAPLAFMVLDILACLRAVQVHFPFDALAELFVFRAYGAEVVC